MGHGVHPYVIHLPWTHATQHPKLHLDRFSRFWATATITVRPMLRDRCPVCPVCLSVCNVGACILAKRLDHRIRMDQDVTWYGGRPRTRQHCVRWELSSPAERGTAASTFRPMSIVAKR